MSLEIKSVLDSWDFLSNSFGGNKPSALSHPCQLTRRTAHQLYYFHTEQHMSTWMDQFINKATSVRFVVKSKSNAYKFNHIDFKNFKTMKISD